MRLLPRDPELGWAPYAYTVYAILFFLYPAMRGAGRAEWIATITGGVLFFILYFRGYWPGKKWTSIVGLTLLALAYYPANPGAGSFFIYAAAFAGWLPPPQARWSIAAIELLVLAESIAFRVHPMQAIWPLIFVLIIGGLNMQHLQSLNSTARLRLAHDEIEHLAKLAERERIARDLHDLLGHTLSVIILKSELAAKLAERDIDRARAEIRDVERISRDALAQVRHAVGGYRAGGLSYEIDSARQTLASAGVQLTTDVQAITLTPAREAVLALAIREGVTNIVRHAAASRATVALRSEGGRVKLIVEDDGRGTKNPFGHGLIGMRERVESIGGTLDREVGGGTRLVISLPLTAGAEECTA